MNHKKGQARRVVFWAAVVLATALLFCWSRDVAMTERGYPAIGGEWLVWLLPVIVWWGIDTVRSVWEIAAEEREGEKREETDKDMR